MHGFFSFTLVRTRFLNMFFFFPLEVLSQGCKNGGSKSSKEFLGEAEAETEPKSQSKLLNPKYLSSFKSQQILNLISAADKVFRPQGLWQVRNLSKNWFFTCTHGYLYHLYVNIFFCIIWIIFLIFFIIGVKNSLHNIECPSFYNFIPN